MQIEALAAFKKEAGHCSVEQSLRPEHKPLEVNTLTIQMCQHSVVSDERNIEAAREVEGNERLTLQIEFTMQTGFTLQSEFTLQNESTKGSYMTTQMIAQLSPQPSTLHRTSKSSW